MNYKRIIGILMLFFILGTGVFARSLAPNTEYRDIKSYNFDLEIEVEGKKVWLEWEEFEGENFMWYKFIYSSSNSNPVYPDHDAQLAGDNQSVNDFETWMKPGEYYVRLCAITQDEDSRGRYCSQVEKVVVKEYSTTTACTREYAPICGQPKFDCPAGADCMEPLPMTYSNKCMLRAAGATYLYPGKCKVGSDTSVSSNDSDMDQPTSSDQDRPTMCTMEYAPVCGKKDGYMKTYSNKCMLRAADAQYISPGECKKDDDYYVDDYDDQDDDYNISDETKRKVQGILDNFIEKLEKKGYSDDKIVDTLEVIIERLEELQSNPKYEDLVEYMIDLIEEIIEEYEDDFDILEDIFSDY